MASAANALRFKARERDAATGLVDLRARWYDPQTGRFLSEDPIGLAGGWNPYTFAGNDPVNLSDPFGLCPTPSGDDGKPCPGLIGALVQLGRMAPAINQAVGVFAAGSVAGGAVGAAAVSAWGGGAALTTLGLRAPPAAASIGAAASRLNVEIEDEIATVSGRGLTVMANYSRSGGTITLDRLHMDGGGPGSAGRTAMREFFTQFGQQMGASRVVVQGAPRGGGLLKGKVPTPQVFDIPQR